MKLFAEFLFFEDYVLTNLWIKFFDLHLARLKLFVFGRGIKIPGSGRRFEFDFFTHWAKFGVRCGVSSRI